MGGDLYARDTFRRLLARVRRAVGQGCAAEDLLQAAFVRLEEQRRRAPIDNPEGFLVRAATNLAIDERRRARTQPLAIAGAEGMAWVADAQPLQDEVLQARESLKRVTSALATLAPRTRTIFLMHRIERMKHREIAAAFGISVSAVEKHVARALFAVSEALSDGG